MELDHRNLVHQKQSSQNDNDSPISFSTISMEASLCILYQNCKSTFASNEGPNGIQREDRKIEYLFPLMTLVRRLFSEKCSDFLLESNLFTLGMNCFIGFLLAH